MTPKTVSMTTGITKLIKEMEEKEKMEVARRFDFKVARNRFGFTWNATIITTSSAKRPKRQRRSLIATFWKKWIGNTIALSVRQRRRHRLLRRCCHLQRHQHLKRPRLNKLQLSPGNVKTAGINSANIATNTFALSLIKIKL